MTTIRNVVRSLIVPASIAGGLAIAVCVMCGHVKADPAADAQAAHARTCDLPNNPARPAEIAGIAPEMIDPDIALPICRAALAADPTNARLFFEMGRGLVIPSPQQSDLTM